MLKHRPSNQDRKYLERTIAILKVLVKEKVYETFNERIGPLSFDMAHVTRTKRNVSDGKACGTAACILGTMRLLANADGINSSYIGDTIPDELFYPGDYHDNFNYKKVTARKAAEVAEKYLATGKVEW